MSKTTAETVLELSFPAKADRLRLVRGLVRDTARLHGCSDQCTDDIVIAVNEACMNVIQHGYGCDSAEKIILRISLVDGELIFDLVDFAAPVDPGTVQPRALDDIRPGGLGVHFIREAMDRMAFLTPPQGAGNLLQMAKRVA